MMYGAGLRLMPARRAVAQAGGRALRQAMRVIMPIRIRCHDKWLHEQQVAEIAGIMVYLLGELTASYTDSKSKIRILYGSI